MKLLLVINLFLLTHLSSSDQVDEAAFADSRSSFLDPEARSKLEWKYMQAVIPSSRVFRLAFNPKMFHWVNGDYGGLERPSYRYTPSLRGQVIMPDWMDYKFSQRHKAGFIYGVPPDEGEYLELDVVALNELTYEYGLLRLSINVTSPDEEDRAMFAVKLKVDNLNLEDVFDAHRLKNLKSVFKDRLWPQSGEDLHLTYIASAVDVGYRRPANPALKDGVVVHLGSASNFSLGMLDLEAEVTPLRSFPNCPRDFKRTSVERFFREKGFAMDWCAFRLLEMDERRDEWFEFGKMPLEDPVVEIPEPEVEIEEPEIIGNSSETNTTEEEAALPPPSPPTTVPNLISTTDVPAVSYFEANVEMFALMALIIVLLFFLLLLYCCCCTRACSNREDDYDEWNGVNSSFCLVFRDCVTCCDGSAKKSVSPAHISAEDDFQTRIRNDPRYRRASSVQRQTDTIRRLAKERCVTPKLQAAPAPGTNVYIPPPEGAIDYNPDFEGYNELAEGGPIIMLSDDGSDISQNYGASPHLPRDTGYMGEGTYPRHHAHLREGSASRGGTLNRRSRPHEYGDPLGTLPRPAPPSYYGRDSRNIVDADPESTYLV